MLCRTNQYRLKQCENDAAEFLAGTIADADYRRKDLAFCEFLPI